MGLRKGGADVVVHEAGDYPRHKVCGEFISGVADGVLRKLGVLDAFDGALRPATLHWRHRDKGVFDGRLPTPARAISRHRLDERLAAMLVDAGGDLRTRERVAVAGGDGWVWAAGRPKRADGGRIGLKAHIRGPRPRAELEMHAGPSGYAGMVEVEDGWLNVCGIFHANRELRATREGRGGGAGSNEPKPAVLLAAYLDAGGCHELAGMIRGAEIRAGSACAVAGFAPGRQPSEARGIRIGDAERMIPPFTGNGMSMAFESAACALDPLLAWARGHISWAAAGNATRAALSRQFRTRMAVAGMLEPSVMRDASANALAFLPPAAFTRTVLPLLR